MRNKAEKFLRAWVRPGDQVIAAVSGGKDSMALLHVLETLAGELSFSLSAAHFNHGLRGEESQRDEAFVKGYCEARGIPLTVGHGDAAAYGAGQGMGIEEAARTLRYDFLLSLSPTAWVATAHTAQDNLETVLMHLLRGSGLHGLTGIPPVRGRILRPLLTAEGPEIQRYLEAHHIPHVEDSTNALDDCLRNRLRHRAVPLLEKESPGLAGHITALTGALRLEDSYLETAAAERLRAAGGEGGALSLEGFFAAPEALRPRMLRQFLGAVPELSARHVEAAAALARSASPSARLSLPGGYTLARRYESLWLLPPGAGADTPEPLRLQGPGTCRFGPWMVTCRRGPRPERLEAGTLALPPEAAPLLLRPRASGDRIVLSGGTKKVSRLMMDEKIPAAWRDTLPVAVRGDTVLAVLPLRAAACCRRRAGEDSLLLSAIRMEEP